MADELYSRIPDTPISDDTARLERIRGALEKLNYSYDGVRELLGERAFEAMARDQVVPGTWRVQNILDDAHTTDPDRRLARMIGFFLFARTLPRAELADAHIGLQLVAQVLLGLVGHKILPRRRLDI